jgi:hypothetical protein
MTVAISSGLFGSMCKEHRFIRESTPVNRREFRPSANSPPPRQPRLCELCAALASRAQPYKVRRLLHSSSKGPNRHQSEGAFPCCTVLILAGLDRANLPITLATVAPASASHGIEDILRRRRKRRADLRVYRQRHVSLRVGHSVCASASSGSLRLSFTRRGTSKTDETSRAPTRCR